MEITYSRDASRYYMMIRHPDTEPDGYEAKMLQGQKAETLLSFMDQQTDGKHLFSYDITGILSLQLCLTRRMIDQSMIGGILKSLSTLVREMEIYLLDPDSLLMDPGCIYMDPEMTRLYFAYVPGYQGSFEEGLKNISSLFLEYTDHQDREGVMMVYELFRLVRNDDFSPGQLVIRNKEREKPERIDVCPVAEIREKPQKPKEKRRAKRRMKKAFPLEEMAVIGGCILGMISLYILYYVGVTAKMIRLAGFVADDWLVMLGMEILLVLLTALFLGKDLIGKRPLKKTEKEKMASSHQVYALFTDASEEKDQGSGL